MPQVIVLGAKGRFGRAAVTAFANAGWDTRAFARNWKAPARAGIERVTGDLHDAATLSRACAGCDVIVHAIHPPYEDWSTEMPRMTKAVIAAAKDCGATVIFPGNVYNYGANSRDTYREDTPWDPTTRKGALRVAMEDAFRASGERTIVLRSGDFLEAQQSGNWFDTVIAAKAKRGKTTYPGPLDRVHAWAYLPDLARAAVMLAEKRETFGTFEEFCFEGYSLTGDALVSAIGKAAGRAQRVKPLAWPLVRLAGFFSKAMYEILEMQYLWSVPHRLSGAKLARTLPDFRPTPLDQAMNEVLADWK